MLKSLRITISYKLYITMSIAMLTLMALILRAMQLQVEMMKQHMLAIENLHRLWNIF